MAEEGIPAEGLIHESLPKSNKYCSSEGSYESDSSWHSPEDPHPFEPRKKRTSEDQDDDYVPQSQVEIIITLIESKQFVTEETILL